MFTTSFKIIPHEDRTTMLVLFVFDREFEEKICKSEMFNVDVKVYIDHMLLGKMLLDLTSLSRPKNDTSDRYYYFTTPTCVDLVERDGAAGMGTVAEVLCTIQNTLHHPTPGHVTTYRDRWECGPGNLWVPEDRSRKMFEREFKELVKDVYKASSNGD